MNFLLDTNLISELIKEKPAPQVLTWFTSIADEHKYISSITLGELSRGINRLDQGRKKNELIAWFDKVQDFFQYQTYGVNAEIAIKWGELSASAEKKGIILPAMDGLIAATAYIHGAIIVSRNTKDFENLPVQVLNPWL